MFYVALLYCGICRTTGQCLAVIAKFYIPQQRVLGLHEGDGWSIGGGAQELVLFGQSSRDLNSIRRDSFRAHDNSLPTPCHTQHNEGLTLVVQE